MGPYKVAFVCNKYASVHKAVVAETQANEISVQGKWRR